MFPTEDKQDREDEVRSCYSTLEFMRASIGEEEVGQEPLLMNSAEDRVEHATQDFTDEEEDDELRPLVIDTTESNDTPSKTTSPARPSEDDMGQTVLDANNDSVSITSEQSFSQYNESSNHSSNDQDSLRRDSGENIPPFVLAERGPDGRVRQPTPSKTRRKSDKILPVAGDDGAQKFICPICKSCLPNNHELTNHIRSHNTTTLASANTCTICGKVLSSQSSLDRHMLVHSGERPFMCKICKMSFTTNGNMHRHMRIHEKEMNAAPGSLMGEAYVKQPSRPRKRSHVNPDGSKKTQGADGKSKSAKAGSDDCSPVKRSLVIEPPRFDLDLAEVTRQHQQHHHRPHLTMIPIKQEADGTQSQPLTCMICNKQFTCQYSLEGHLEEAHPDHVAHCSKCNVTFRSAKGLHIHHLLVHLKNKADGSRSVPELDSLQIKQMLQLGTNGSSNHPSIPIGFHDLSFVDFTCENFPLVAKAWCEKKPRRSASEYHDYTCRRCRRSFPCGSALKLHLETHPPDCMAVCADCDCNFIDTQKFEDHMIQHSQDKIVSSYVNTRGADDNDIQDMVAKEDFLLVCGLKASEEQEKPDDLNKRKQVDLKMNDTYYVRLGEVKPYRIETQEPQSLVMPAMPKALTQLPLGSAHPNAQPLPAQQLQRVRMNLAKMMDHPVPQIKQEPGCRLDVEGSPGVSNGLSRKEDSPDRADREQGPFRCDYCDEVFTNYRFYKSHIRAHLGLSPYKCNLCTYSSADKSTLIRHLRTHNGERPFQCLVCDFAFTTKANCERHVRKKHGHVNRDEIDRVIGYNQFIKEPSTIEEECFASPDTVCKYCGEDFKFFRALKHHLRSHSSCRSKPFMCKLCNNGFSTKANCMRHIQKQHLEVEQNQVEQNIHVNELYLDIMDQGGDSDGSNVSQPRAGTSQGRWWAEGENVNSQPAHAADSGRLLPPSLIGRSAAPIPGLHPRSRTYITTPPVATYVKAEEERQEEQPLDCSMKATKQQPRQQQRHLPLPHTSSPRDYHRLRPATMVGGTSDQPIDLTVKKPTSGSSVDPAKAPSMAAPNLPQFMRQPATNVVAPRVRLPFQPTAVRATASQGASKPSTLQTKHPNLLVHIRTHTKDQLHRCEYCPAVFTLRTDLENHLRVTHKVTVSMESLGLRPGAAPPTREQIPMPPALLKMTRPQEPTEINNNDTKPCDSHCHGTTMQPRPTESSTAATDSSDSELTPVTRMLDTANVNKLQSFLPGANDGQKAKSNDLQPMENRSGASTPQKRSLSPDVDEKAVAFGDLSDNDSDAGTEGGDGEHASKKKRNSYSDSPHKLHCPYCPRAFPWISSLKRHLLTHTGHKPFKCPQCPVTFSTKSNRERHMIRKHGLNVHDPATRQMMDRPYKCHLCVFSSFASGSNLIRHYKEKHPEKEIPDNVMSVVAMGATDDQCSFLDKLDLQDAMSEVSDGRSSGMMELEDEDQEMDSHNLDPEEEVAQVMGMADDGLSRRLLDQSTPCSTPETVMSEKHVNPERDNYNVDKIMDCWKCGAAYDSRKALLRHLKEHNIDFPFKCYLCDASYDDRRECLDHAIEKHPSDWDMLREKNKVNDIDYFIQCMNEIVEQTLSGNLDGRTSEALTRMQLEELRPESDYAQRKVYCTLCPKRFWSLQDLRRHMRSHTGERPFECDICSKRFTLKHSMMRHRRKHADITNTSAMSMSDEEVNSVADENAGADATFRASLINSYGREVAQSDSNRSTPTWSAENIPFATSSQASPRVERSSSPLRASAVVRRASPLQPSPLANSNNTPSEDGPSSSDILQNLLGIEGSDLDTMLTSTPDDAAKILGV